MAFRKLGKTDLQLTEVTFGAWAIGGWMWGGNEGNDAIAAIKASIEAGITSIDTAPIYGQGESEELGHSSLSTTKHYLDGFESDSIHKTTDLLLVFHQKEVQEKD